MNRFDFLFHSAISFLVYLVNFYFFVAENEISIEIIIAQRILRVRDLEKDSFQQREDLGKYLADSRNQRTVHCRVESEGPKSRNEIRKVL